MTDAIEEMAGLAADAIENTRIGKELAGVALTHDDVTAIIARYYRELEAKRLLATWANEGQVRELVLAAREHVSQSAGWPSDSGRKERLRAILEKFKEVR